MRFRGELLPSMKKLVQYLLRMPLPETHMFIQQTHFQQTPSLLLVEGFEETLFATSINQS